MELMTDPVVISDGFSYERSAIEMWLATHTTSPMTGGNVENTILPNNLLRNMIREWKLLNGVV
jgi:hypothetical protein